MPTAKKNKTSQTTVKRPRKKSTPSVVKVTRASRATRVKKDHIIDLSKTFAPDMAEDIFGDEPAYQEPYKESPVFDVNEDDFSDRPSRWTLSLYQRIAVTFTVLSLLSLGAVLYFTYLRLDITIHPATKTVEAKTNFTVYDRPENYQMPDGSVLGMVRSMQVEQTQSVPATGKEITGAEVAGTVTLVNNYTKDQPLVATTRLLTPNNQLLRLTESVVVPAGGTIQSNVYAETADPSFTLADTHLTIPGLWAGLQSQIYGEAKAGAVTYKEKAVLSVTQADIDEAVRQGKIALLEKAQAEIESVYASYDEKLYQFDDSSLTATPDSKIGDKKDTVSVVITGSVNVVAFHKKDITNILGTALTAVGSNQDPLADANPMFTITSADVNDNVAQIEARTSAYSTNQGEGIVKTAKLKGLRRSQVEGYLNNIPEIASYELKFRPSFFTWAPYNINNIKVSVE